MVVNFIVIVSQEEEGVTSVFPFPALLPAKKKADRLAAEDLPPYDIVVWDVVANSPAYSPFEVATENEAGNKDAAPKPQQ